MMEEERIRRVQDLLSQASEAHHVYEQKVLDGRPNGEWSEWYAEYLIGHGLDNILGDELAAEMLARFFLGAEMERRSRSSGFSWAQFAAREMVQWRK